MGSTWNRLKRGPANRREDPVVTHQTATHGGFKCRSVLTRGRRQQGDDRPPQQHRIVQYRSIKRNFPRFSNSASSKPRRLLEVRCARPATTRTSTSGRVAGASLPANDVLTPVRTAPCAFCRRLRARAGLEVGISLAIESRDPTRAAPPSARALSPSRSAGIPVREKRGGGIGAAWHFPPTATSPAFLFARHGILSAPFPTCHLSTQSPTRPP